jgi:hypothetical protein
MAGLFGSMHVACTHAHPLPLGRASGGTVLLVAVSGTH